MKIVSVVGSNPLEDNMNFNQISDFMQKNGSSSPEIAIDGMNDTKNPLLTTYPWILYFRQKCLSELKNSNMRSLMKLIKLYSGNISKAVEECYHKPKRALKLKIEISNTLTYFHYAYKEIKTPLEHFSYLEKMSDLMAMYVDMEINASRTGIESVSKVSSMITSSLKLYFGKYPEYILGSVLKTKLITKRCSELGDLIFGWVLRDSPEYSLDIIKYIQNILAYKMWKEIMQDSRLKQQRIAQLACRRLEPPVGFKEKLESIPVLRDLFPILPKSDITNFLMKAKFSSRKKTQIFYKAVADPIVLTQLNHTSFPVIDDSGSIFSEKGNTKVDQLLNNVWDIFNGNRGLSSSLTKNIASSSSDDLLKNTKFKRKREDNNCISSEPNKRPPENSSLSGEDKHAIKLETEDIFNRLTYESLYQYEHSIEDFFHAEEENKDRLCWKSDVDKGLKEKDNYIMKEDKLEDFDASECYMKSDFEDEIISSSNECLFDLKEDFSVVEDSVYSEDDDTPYSVSREADSVSTKSSPSSVRRKATSTSRRGRRKGRGRPKKMNIVEQSEESNKLLDELTTTDGFFK